MNKRFFIIIAILIVGASLMVTVVKTAPKPVKKPIVELAPLVETMALVPSDRRPTWQGGAAVNGNQSVKLVAQVSGQILSVNPLAVPGSFVKKGAVLAQVDSASYQLVYEQKKAKEIQAQSSLDMELAQVENAKKDYQRSGMKLNPAGKALALREPQLASAKAVLAFARSELKKAKLDLNRTRITMPFDGHVLAQNSTVGAFVNNASAVFEVLDASAYWLEVKVPQSFLQILDLEQYAKLTVNGVDQTRDAKILTVLPQVDATDRQARILISIEDPLLITQASHEGTDIKTDLPAIRYNDYVHVTLSGKGFKHASMIKTDSLNASGNVWVVDDKLVLQNRTVEVLYAGREFSWVNISTKLGDQILLSRIDAPKAGMVLRVLNNASEMEKPNNETAIAHGAADKQPALDDSSPKKVQPNNKSDLNKNHSSVAELEVSDK
jgi:RND family efflux transporter MFP subunit